jgi:hypothetical protein
MKGLDKEALRDPKAAAAAYGLAATPGANSYSYQAWQDDGTSECTAAAADCTKYTLTAVPEGGGANIVQTSLN